MTNVPVEACASCHWKMTFQDRFCRLTPVLGGVFAFSQVGSTNSTVPSAPAYNSNEFWSSLSPAGLSDVVKQLCDALRPHLNRR